MTGNGGEYPPFYFVYAKIVMFTFDEEPFGKPNIGQKHYGIE